MNAKLERQFIKQTRKLALFTLDDDSPVYHSTEYIQWLEARVKKQKKSKRKSYLKGYADGLELGCALSHSKHLRHTRPPKD